MEKRSGKNFYAIPSNVKMLIEGDDIWFVSVLNNVLCRGRKSDGVCECVAKIPAGKEGYARSTPLCMKDQDNIILLPDLGKNIWIYNLRHDCFRKIEIEHIQQDSPGIYDCWIIDRTLWAWSGRFGGMQCLIEMDLDYCRIQGYHYVMEGERSAFVWQPARWENFIYLYENNTKKLYEFDVISREKKIYELNGVTGVIVTICCDRDTLWLAGEEACIYVWDKTTKKLEAHTNFPKEFHITRTDVPPVDQRKWSFYQSVCTDGYACFVPRNIPGTMCTGIVFMDKKDHSMRLLKLYDETGNGSGTYTLEYTVTDRYVGIYYHPNCFISEIDTVDFEVREKRLRFFDADYTKL